MDKNYYDILQVNRNASPEIIEKAYKVLAKKYHPDLQQTQQKKKQAEEILKEINEAYEVLSDSKKKQEYDLFFTEQNRTVVENSSTNSSEDDSLKNPASFSNEEIIGEELNTLYHQKLQQDLAYQEQLHFKQEQIYQEQLRQATQKAYYDAYIQDLKNRGYKIRYKKTLKDYFRIFVTIIVISLILFALWQLPFVRNYFTHLYEENETVHFVFDFFSNLFFD